MKRKLPPRSPFSLIQEDLWPNTWWILIGCVLLNQTSRKQVERTICTLLQRWPTPRDIIDAPEFELESVLRPLGLVHRRVSILKKLAAKFNENSNNVTGYPGVGVYATQAWHLFVRQGVVSNEEATDHALKLYVCWKNNICKR